MLEDLEERLEELKTEGPNKRSFKRLRGPSDGEGGDWLGYGQHSHQRRFFGYPNEPPRRHDPRRLLQPLPDPSPYQGRDASALELSRASLYPPPAQRSYRYTLRPSYSEATSFNPFDDSQSGYSRSARGLPNKVNETRTSQSRRKLDDDSWDRPTKPVIRFEKSKPSTTQELGAGAISSASNDQSLILSGPLFGPAGGQFRSRSPIPPKPSMPSLNPTLNNLISEWTTIKLDAPKDKQQPAEAMGLLTPKGNKGNEPQLSDHDQVPSYPTYIPTPSSYPNPYPYASPRGLIIPTHHSNLNSHPPLPPLTRPDHRRDPKTIYHTYPESSFRRERKNGRGGGGEVREVRLSFDPRAGGKTTPGKMRELEF